MEESAPLEVEFDEQNEEVEEQSKDYLGKIIAVIVILLVAVAAYFAINYYLEIKYSKLRVVVKDFSGKELDNSQVIVSNEFGFLEKRMGNATYEFELESGKYTIIVRSPGYKEKRLQIKLTQDRELKVVLEKEAFLRIKSIEMPAELICPSLAYGTITIENLSDKEEQASVSFDGFSGLQLSLVPKTVLVPGQQQAVATIEIKCSKVSSEKEVSGYVSIGGLQDKNYLKIKLLPMPEIYFEKELSVELDANESAEQSIVFQNKAGFKVKGMLLRIESVKEKNSKIELSNVLSFDKETEQLEKKLSFEPNGVERVTLYIKAPKTNKDTELIGKLALEAPFYPKAQEISITINVKGVAEDG
ncbi:MAG: PEGA domain-containing protein [Candidatus Diapherotrites archaeon]|nr:PEGA domain-containing protein [Candidatus Diapherotrites archaeon]